MEPEVKSVETVVPEQSVACPYPGLRSFNEQESLYFKGREGQVEEVIEKIQEHKFLLVTGASGDGKSSLVFAGLIPNCRAGFFKSTFNQWTITSFRPERSPLDNLAKVLFPHFQIEEETLSKNLKLGYSALVDEYKNSELYLNTESEDYQSLPEEEKKAKRKRATNLLIIVDQFEEFFTNVENFNRETSTATDSTQIMINLLLETVRIAREENLPIYIVCTMRSDYLGQCSALNGFPEQIVESQFYLTRLRRRDIIQVIEEPAMLSGNSITERLIQRLLNDIRGGRDVLPVLQHCLLRIWHAADKGKEEMDLIHYAMVGGMKKEELPKEDQSIFTEWFNQQSKQKQSYYANPSLHNVLNIHADELNESTTNNQTKQISETTFKCLTKIDDNRAIRNLMTLQEITEMLGDNYSTEQVAETIDQFREQGNTLIRPFKSEQDTITKDTVLDITHEALIRNWQRLSDWSWEEHASVQMYREFRSQLDKWKNNNNQKSYLMSVGSLSYYNEEWFKPQKADPKIWLKRYMWDSEKEAQEQTHKDEKAEQHFQEIKEYLKKSKQNVNRKKILAQIATITITLLLIIVSIAYYNSEKLKTDIVRTAKANMIATRAYMELEKDPTLAFRLAEAAYAIEPTPLAKQVIMAGYGEMPFYQKLEGHTGPVTQAKYSPDGNYIVTAGYSDQLILLWDFRNLNKVELKGHKGLLVHGNPGTINWSPDGRYIVSASTDSTARIWDLEGNCLAVLKHDGPVNSVYFSPQSISVIPNEGRNLLPQNIQGEYLVLTASSDKTARLWDLEGNELVSFEGMNSSLTLAKFIPNSEFVVAIADTTCIIYNLNGNIQTKLKGHTKNIYDLDISKNGSFIATSGYDNTAKIWDRNGKLVLNIDEHKRIVAIVRFSDDEKFVLTASDDLNINVWTLGGKKIANLTGHQSTIWSAGFSPNAKKIISASDDGTARLWNLDGQELMLFKGHTSQVMSASYSPDGKHVITASGDGTARIWNIHPKENPNLKGHKAVVRDVDISNDGKRIITAGFDYTAKLWSSNGKLLKTLTGFDAYGLDYVKFNSKSNMFAVGCNEQVKVYNDLGDSIVELRGHGGNITTAHFITENHAIITYSNDKNAFVWNLNGEKFQKIEKIEGLKVFGQGKELITINTDTSWSYWKMYFENDSIKFRKINTIRCHDASINSIDIHHEKNMVLTTSDDSTAIIWNLNSGNKIDKLISYSCRLKLGIFSPNGNKVCITTQDHIILLFSNISDRKPQIHHLRGHSDDITDVNFSNDGKHIVSASNDNTIKVWNLAGVNVMTLPNHKAAVMKAMFSPDDNFILSASQDHTARLTPWRVEDVLQKINVDKVRGEVWELGEKDKEVYGIE